MYAGNPSEWGSKRTCGSCAAKFYDLRRHPAVCPKCGTEFVAPPPPRSSASAARGAPVRGRNRATPFGHGQSPWPGRSGSHSPFGEARTAAKISDDGDEDVRDAKNAGTSEGEEGQSR